MPPQCAVLSMPGDLVRRYARLRSPSRASGLLAVSAPFDDPQHTLAEAFADFRRLMCPTVLQHIVQ